MDEFFETLTLVQTKSITRFPIVLFGVKYYQPLMDYLHLMAHRGTIQSEDLNLVLLTDNIDSAMEHIQTYVLHNYQVKPRKKIPWLLEKR
jgi:predicted Rossmann-fold nucleotide-binding protein